MSRVVFHAVFLAISILTAPEPEIMDFNQGASFAGALTCLFCIGATMLAEHTTLDFAGLGGALFIAVSLCGVSALLTGNIICWLIYFILGIPFWFLLLAARLQHHMRNRRDQVSNFRTTILSFLEILLIYFHCLRSKQIMSFNTSRQWNIFQAIKKV